MPATSLPRIPLNADQQQQIIAFNQLVEELDYLLGGFLDSKNAREFGGWIIAKDNLASKDGDVGMSTKDTVADDIRFWAGDAIDGVPKFKVTKAGILTAIAAILMSAAGYPRVEMNSTNSLFGAYQAADKFVRMDPAASGSTPGFTFQNGPGVTALLYLLTTDLFMATPAGSANIQISSGSDLFLNSNGSVKLNPSGSLQINGTSGYTGFVDVVTSVTFGPTGGGTYTTKRITFTKGVVTGVS